MLDKKENNVLDRELIINLTEEFNFKGLGFNIIKCLSSFQIHHALLAFILLFLLLLTLESPFLPGKFLLVVKISVQKYRRLRNVPKCLILN